MKYRIVHLLQKYLLNPPVKILFAIGIARPGYALLETIGHRTGKPPHSGRRWARGQSVLARNLLPPLVHFGCIEIIVFRRIKYVSGLFFVIIRAHPIQQFYSPR
jgi:hypothetical protein